MKEMPQGRFDEYERYNGGNDSSDILERQEAEQALLGAIFINNKALTKIPSDFEVEHFYEPIHREIYRAILKCIDSGKTANPVTIRTFLSPETSVAKIGTMTVAQYLARLASEAVSIVNAPDYADAITDAYRRREAINVSEHASIAARKSADELEFISEMRECRDRLSSLITSVEVRNEPQETFGDVVDRTLDFTANALSGKVASGLDYGIPQLTQLMGPLGKSELLVIGGDVKTGKSSLAWQIFFSMAEKHPIAGFSGEMGKEQIIMREKARRTGVSARRQKRGQVKSEEFEDLLRAGVAIKKLRHIDIISKQITLDDIDERINRLQGEFGIEAFLVDHILKLAWTGKMEDADDFKKANRATSTLKNIAMKRNIPIIALTHINKTATENTYGKSYRDRLMSVKRRRPTYKNMLGNIDKDVDNMIIVHQAYPAIAGMEPEENTPDYELWRATMDEVKGKAEFILALSRENEFPRRQEIEWNGERTCFGPNFLEARYDQEMFG